jgi:hypothetical protein
MLSTSSDFSLREDYSSFYNDEIKEYYNSQKRIFDEELKILQYINKLPNYYKNQERTAIEIVEKLKDRKILNIMVIGKTQSGKTGTMIATIKKYLEDPESLIDITNIYVITGLSNCEWLNQTKKRFPNSIKVFHRPELENEDFLKIKNKKNVLIIIDEVHIASTDSQSIKKSFEKIGLLNKNKLYNDDIKIVEFTATPDGIIFDLDEWKDAKDIIFAEVNKKYISSYNLLQNGRLQQFKPLTDRYQKNIEELKEFIEDRFLEPRYHIIRITNSHKYIQVIFKDYKIIKYYQNYKFNINDLLKDKPNIHTIIFVKEKLRCAKTLEKKYIGVLYERYSNSIDDSVIIQGFAGRFTGYDLNEDGVVFTNKDTIERYENIFTNHFQNKEILWNSKTTYRKNKITYSKCTFIHLKYYTQTLTNKKLSEPIIKFYKSYEEVNTYCKTIGDKNRSGPHNKEPNKNGFYELKINNETKVYSRDEVIKTKRWALTNDNYRVCPCYENIEDNSTLIWIVLHY